MIDYKTPGYNLTLELLASIPRRPSYVWVRDLADDFDMSTAEIRHALDDDAVRPYVQLSWTNAGGHRSVAIVDHIQDYWLRVHGPARRWEDRT